MAWSVGRDTLAIVMPLRGMDHTILIPGVALRSTPGYSHAATNVAKCARVPFTFDTLHFRPCGVEVEASLPTA